MKDKHMFFENLGYIAVAICLVGGIIVFSKAAVWLLEKIVQLL